jgi:hypothetical protein
MGWRDRKRFEIVKSILDMPDEYVSSVIDYMDRKNLNPDWFAMSDSEIVEHMVGVIASFRDSVDVKMLLQSFKPATSEQDSFEKKWMKLLSEDQ